MKKGALDKALVAAREIKINEAQPLVFMSDLHRGNGNWADDAARNMLLFCAALREYHRRGYIYIELGDGDELWKCRTMAEIKGAHREAFGLLEAFRQDGRFYALYGNHDMEKRILSRRQQLPPMTAQESLLLRYGDGDLPVLLLHGHQADFFNNTLWRLARFLVRYLWEPLALYGLHNPTSAAKNNAVQEKVELRLSHWSQENGLPVVTGHTHRPLLPPPGEGTYFNDGSGVHPFGVTALELVAGAISLVRWAEGAREDGVVHVQKEVLAGPYSLEAYYEKVEVSLPQ